MSGTFDALVARGRIIKRRQRLHLSVNAGGRLVADNAFCGYGVPEAIRNVDRRAWKHRAWLGIITRSMSTPMTRLGQSVHSGRPPRSSGCVCLVTELRLPKFPTGHTALFRRWINVIVVDSTSQQRRVPSGLDPDLNQQFCHARARASNSDCWLVVCLRSDIEHSK